VEGREGGESKKKWGLKKEITRGENGHTAEKWGGSLNFYWETLLLHRNQQGKGLEEKKFNISWRGKGGEEGKTVNW